MKHIGIFSNSGAVQTAIENETLLNPYVALVSGSLDYNSVVPTPPVPPAETRMKVTYHLDAPGEILLISDPWDSSLVSVEVSGTVIPLGGNIDPEMEYVSYTASTSGDIVAYFTFSGDTIGADNEYSMELFYPWDGLVNIPIVSIEIPDNLPNIGHNALAYVGGDDGILSAVTIPDVPMSFGKEAFRGNKKLQVVKTASMSGTGYIYIPSGSTLDRYAFGECGRYADYEEPYLEHMLITAATFGAGVNFVDNYWEDEGDERPMGYQFEVTPIIQSTFLGTVPPTIQMNTLYWQDEWHPTGAQVPTGYESDYVSSFNTQIWEDSEGLGWYFVEGLPSDDHSDCESGPTPGHIFAVLEPDAEYRCYLNWGCYDEGTDTCYPCGECPQEE